MIKRLVILALFALCVLCVTAQESFFSNIAFPKHEERAVWLATIGGIDWPRNKATDERSTERQKQELCDILDKLKKANINVVILQTRIRGSVIYPSEIEPWDQAITGRSNVAPSYDPLEFAIEECHKRGMELHAWLVSIPLGTSQRQKAYGSKSIMRHHASLCKAVGGEMFMQPGKPETADYIAELCREIVARYDVDGISLDYIRYPESQYRFNDEDLYKKQKAQGQTLSEWRRENITRIVRRVHDVVKAIKPWVRLSSSPIGKYRDLNRYSSRGWNCYDVVYQDPQGWLRDNLQDVLFPMMYFQGNHFYPFLYDWKENSYGHPVVPGLGIYFLDPHEGTWKLNDVRAQMYTARNSGIGGIAFYRSQFLTDNTKGLYDATCEELFQYPALTTRMTWTGDTLPPAPPTDIVKTDNKLTWKYGSTHQGKWQMTYFNVYASNIYPVDTENAMNLVASRLQTTSMDMSINGLEGKYFAVTAMDRYGNESKALQQPYFRPANTPEFIQGIVKQQFAKTSPKAKKVKTKKVKAKKPSKTEEDKKATTSTAPKAEKQDKPQTKPSSAKTTQKTVKQKEKKEKKSTEVKVIDFSKYLD